VPRVRVTVPMTIAEIASREFSSAKNFPAGDVSAFADSGTRGACAAFA